MASRKRHLYIFLRARNGHCAHWYNCIARDLVPNGGIMGWLADDRYVYCHLVFFNYYTRGLCAQLGRRFSYSAIWVSLLVWRRALGAKRDRKSTRLNSSHVKISY